MTYKSAMAGMRYGGGKAVIVGDPARDKTEALLEHLRAGGRAARRALPHRHRHGPGRARHQGHVPRDAARHAHGLGSAHRFRGPGRARRVGLHREGGAGPRRPLRGLHVAVQGLGEVGRRLARQLARGGGAADRGRHRIRARRPRRERLGRGRGRAGGDLRRGGGRLLPERGGRRARRGHDRAPALPGRGGRRQRAVRGRRRGRSAARARDPLRSRLRRERGRPAQRALRDGRSWTSAG